MNGTDKPETIKKFIRARIQNAFIAASMHFLFVDAPTVTANELTVAEQYMLDAWERYCKESGIE